jgi:hypothetical protein
MRGQESISFRRGINKQKRRWKESNMLNSVSQKTPRMNKGERKESIQTDKGKKSNKYLLLISLTPHFYISN